MKDCIPSTIDGAAERKLLVLLSVQAGVIDRSQALSAGFTRSQISHRLRSGAWQRVFPGVYATFTGPLPRNARLWAAVRCAGDGAMVSHQTAAEVHGMTDEPASPIHVTVPHSRRPARDRQVRGIVIHRSDQSRQQFLGPFNLPRTSIEDTVLDLVAAAPTFDRAYAWIARAVSRKLVSVAALRAALGRRRRIRWRGWLTDALQDAENGVYSSLERRYVMDVERAHGLPRSEHQARRLLDGKVQYRDNWYPRYRVVVEVDGPDYHQNERVQIDKDRDNRNLALDDVKTHRFGPVDVTQRACQSAALIAATLQRNGWAGVPHSCRRAGCTVGRPVSRPRAS
jgi:predicted transcriptional regulator of viral defense system